jgi:hypothetical protein
VHRESPIDATVTTHSSIMTNVTVVPEVSAETIKRYQKIKRILFKLYIHLKVYQMSLLNDSQEKEWEKENKYLIEKQLSKNIVLPEIRSME